MCTSSQNSIQNLLFSLEAVDLSLLYTFPGGEPRIKPHNASLQKPICCHSSAAKSSLHMTQRMKRHLAAAGYAERLLPQARPGKHMGICDAQHQLQDTHVYSQHYLATLMFWYEPKMCILVSAITILVFVAFSIVNLVLPFCTHSLESEACKSPYEGRPNSDSYAVGDAQHATLDAPPTLPANRPMHLDKCSPLRVCKPQCQNVT